jgi:hypothetical protein
MPIRPSNRRDFIRLTLGTLGMSAGATLLAPLRRGVAQTGPPLRTTPLRDGLVQIESEQANVLLLHTPAGGLLVDSGSRETAAALSHAVAEHLAARRSRRCSTRTGTPITPAGTTHSGKPGRRTSSRTRTRGSG